METNASKSWLTWRFFGISVLFWTVTMGVSASTVPYYPDLWQQLTKAATSFFSTLAVFSITTVVLFEHTRRIGRTESSWPKYAAKALGAAALTSMLHQLIISWETSGEAWTDGFWMFWLTTAFQHVAILGIGAATNIYITREAARSELLQMQLRALRNQLQPHFLFNSLQGISASVRSEPDTAVRMITLLGDLLRQTLRERSNQLVTLAEEHQLLEPYLELQKLRFADRLTVEIDLPDDVLSAAVPDLILQPLVENALLHGIEKQPGEGSVRISARRDGDRLELKVADDGAGPGDGPIADGVGLGTTRSRLQALFGERAQLTLAAGDLRGTVVTVNLPWQEARDAA